jgi:RNA polymerase sigma-70 factor (ECF subfamily)
MERSAAAILRHFDEHHAPLFRFAWRLTGSVADAEDIVQECFLALLRPGCAFDPHRTALRTYLFGAVRNQALKRLRPPEAPADTPEPLTPERECYDGELKLAVARAIRQLPEGQREVLLLAHYEQMALSEIAEILHIELGAVKSRLQRARASLKDMLAAYSPNRRESHE